MQTPLVLTSLQLAKALIGLDANVKMANPHNAMQTRALFSKKSYGCESSNRGRPSL